MDSWNLQSVCDKKHNLVKYNYLYEPKNVSYVTEMMKKKNTPEMCASLYLPPMCR